VFNSDIYVGEQLWVEFHLTNRTDETVTLSLNSGCFWELDVLDEHGRRVVRRSGHCVSEHTTLSVPKGVLVYMTGSISTVRDRMSDAEWYLKADRLPPGRYRVRGGLSRRWLAARWDEKPFTVSVGPR
jgi:hypothetical protein